MGLPKHLLGDDEELVLVIRPHKRVLVAPVLILLLVLAVAGLLWAVVPDGSAESWLQWLIVIVAAGAILRWVAWPFVRWWSTVYAITTHRLVTRTGVIRRSGHDMPLSRLNDVSFSHSLIQRILGCGTIVAESGGEQGQLVLRDIPDVERVQRTLYQLAEDARQGEFGASLEDEETADETARTAPASTTSQPSPSQPSPSQPSPSEPSVPSVTTPPTTTSADSPPPPSAPPSSTA